MTSKNLVRAEDQPAFSVIKNSLIRFGDQEGVAHGRALGIVEALLDSGMLKRADRCGPAKKMSGIVVGVKAEQAVIR